MVGCKYCADCKGFRVVVIIVRIVRGLGWLKCCGEWKGVWVGWHHRPDGVGLLWLELVFECSGFVVVFIFMSVVVGRLLSVSAVRFSW